MENHYAAWEAFGAELRRFLLRQLPSESDADDVLQEVFLKLHTRQEAGDSPQSVRGWIFQVARNAVADFYRAKASRREENLPERLADEAERAEPQEAASILAPSLSRFLESLPERYREAVRLAEIEGLDQRAVAERLQLSWSGAKSRIQRGRELLRRRLEECCHFELDRRGRILSYEEHCCRGAVKTKRPG